MTKYRLEDMVKIKNSEKTRGKTKTVVTEKAEVSFPRNNNKHRYMLWSLAIFSIMFCFFAISIFFSTAHVVVNPKMAELTLDENLSASKDSKNGALAFDLIVIDGVESASVVSGEQKDKSETATGSVVIYNTFSSSAQILSVDTRLEGSNGKIYKTKNKVVVPGILKDGKPGSVEVGIYAEEAGEEYNSNPLDFKIFGFRGSPKYSKFYARSKGDITGGFKGKVPAISDSEKTNLLVEMKEKLEAKLLRKSIEEIPAGFVLFKDAIFLDSKDPDVLSAYDNNTITFTMKGTFYGILFNERELTKKIIKENIEEYDGNEVYITNIKDLDFSLSKRENVLFDNLKDINFNLSGIVKVVWKIEVDKFSLDLIGKKKNDFNDILLEYKNIESATLKISPFWKMVIPSQEKKIKIIVNYP